MSIAGAIHAEWSNKQKDIWVADLEAAYVARDWDAVKAILDAMRKFKFSE